MGIVGNDDNGYNEKNDNREILRENPRTYIGQLYATFIRNVDNKSESIPTIGTACLIQLEELSQVL